MHSTVETEKQIVQQKHKKKLVQEKTKRKDDEQHDMLEHYTHNTTL